MDPMVRVFEGRRLNALRLIQRIHAGQFRGDGTVPAWHHLERVSRTLERILEETGEGPRAEREIIVLAALGHDALEDTTVTRDELDLVFAPRGLELIVGMTNPHGDGNHGPYVSQVASAEEAVRLIKLSDLYDNCTSVTHQMYSLGSRWAEEWFLPISWPMATAVLPTTFPTYPVAAERLKGMVRNSLAALRDEIARYHAAGR
jgi:(p)ppGpp synthase/HD superfamily hydrolase